MRAVICRELTGVGGLEYVDNWPEPQAGPGEVLVDVKAAALNFPDLLMIQGLYQERPPLPFVVGTEMAGVVAAVGEGVGHVAVGDRVVAACGRALAERVAVKAPLVIPAPRALDFTAASGICITYFTTMYALKQRAQLQAGETLLVLGAAGGVGTTAVELGKQMGATVIAAASSDAKLDLTRRLGADHVVNYATQDLRERIKEITGGKGVDVVYDPVGGSLAEPALRSMAWRGRYLVIGFAEGSIPALPWNLPLLKGASIVGVFWGEFVKREPAAHAAGLKQLAQWYAQGLVKPVIDQRLPMSELKAAYERMGSRQAMVKLLLVNP